MDERMKYMKDWKKQAAAALAVSLAAAMPSTALAAEAPETEDQAAEVAQQPDRYLGVYGETPLIGKLSLAGEFVHNTISTSIRTSSWMMAIPHSMIM